MLIVDGFDRTDAWGQELAHPLAQRLSANLDHLGVSHDACADEAVANSLVLLNDYHAVIWILGAEEADMQTIAYDELAKLAHYLRLGGNLLITGSDLGL